MPEPDLEPDPDPEPPPGPGAPDGGTPPPATHTPNPSPKAPHAMSEELIKDYRNTIAELRAENAKLKEETYERRHKAKAVTAEQEARIKALAAERDGLAAERETLFAENEAMVAEREEQAQALTEELGQWKARAEASPGELAQQLESLKAELLTRDRRDDWKSLVGDQLNDKVKLERVWEAAGYKPGAEPPTPEEIKELVGKAREAEPYLFRQEAAPGTGSVAAGAARVPAPKPPLAVNGAGGRGARDTAPGHVSYRKGEIAEPGWERARPELKAALARNDGSAVLLPD